MADDGINRLRPPRRTKPVPVERYILPNISGANLGLSFENQGLRAKAVLERTPKNRQ